MSFGSSSSDTLASQSYTPHAVVHSQFLFPRGHAWEGSNIKKVLISLINNFILERIRLRGHSV